MEPIGIVTDSTADLSPEQIRKYGIQVVPISVHFGSETYADGIDLPASEFYERLAASKEMPRTSQPNPQAFLDAYRELLKTKDTILSIHLSGRLSGTLNSAVAASQLTDAKVITVDTKTASQGVGRSVLIAAEAVQRGWPLSSTLDILYHSINQTFSVFSVDTLEYLHRNGRIGRAASYLGHVLRIKPILYANSEGMVAPYGKVRGRSKIIPKLIDAAQRHIIPGSAVNLSVVHSGAVEAAHVLLANLRSIYKVKEYHLGMVGPAIGAHIGPGALGVMIQPSFESLASSLGSQKLASNI
jgi:DegV family protein with EDD domain